MAAKAVFSLHAHTRAHYRASIIGKKEEKKEKKGRKNTEQVGRQVASLAFSPVEKCAGGGRGRNGRSLYTVERI